MQIIENYLTAVSHYLPKDNKDDVIEELRVSLTEQIEDREAENNRQLTKDELIEMVKALGHPMKVAASYSPQQYLIGPTLFPTYKQVLRIAIIALFLIQILFAVIGAIVSQNSALSVFGVIFNAFDTILFGAFIVTAAFAFMEYSGDKLNFFESWAPFDGATKLVPSDRQDAITNVVTDSVLLIWWNNWFGLPNNILFEANGVVVRSAEIYTMLYWPVNALLVISLLTYSWMLLTKYWTPLTNKLSIGLDIATLVVLGLIIQTEQHFRFDIPAGEDAKFTKFLTHVSDYGLSMFLMIIACFIAWDLFTHSKVARQLKSD